MKYYRFNRKGRYDTFSLNTYLKSQKKTEYMVNTKRSKKLESFFLENQVWGALHKCWKGYTVAKNKDEHDKMEIYARRIQECQHDLGLPISSFDSIGMSAEDFLSEITHKENNNSQEEEQVSYEQDYQADSQYESERLTDTYTEYLRDDFNAGDRFTS
jgi:hypothetical protein